MLFAHDRGLGSLCTHCKKSPADVRLFPVDDAYEHLCILTLLPSLGPLHLTLADALSPHGSSATLASVGTLSEGFERLVTSPLYLVGYVRWDARSDQSSFVKQSFQQLSGRNPRNRLRGHVPEPKLPNTVMDQNETSGEFGLPTSTERAYYGQVD